MEVVPLLVLALIVAVPTPTAFNSPELLTDTTVESSEDHVIVLSSAFEGYTLPSSVTVSPALISAGIFTALILLAYV